MVKQYLREKGAPFEEIDISDNHQACTELLELTGRMSIPVIRFGDSYVIGFSRQRIDLLLEMASTTEDPWAGDAATVS